ncbi:MAG: cation transporter [Acidimicrobiia bacterium]|nr:cation transporter [Acidimicrobiia bacterium]
MNDHRRTGRQLQQLTIGWNIAEVFVTVGLGIAAGSLALVAFGLDSLIEVFASVVVLWHMAPADHEQRTRDDRARRLVAVAFALLAGYLMIASVRALWTQAEPDSSPIGIAYLAVTAVVMFALARAKNRVGRQLGSEPFVAEARLTFLDGCLATAILVALTLNTAFGWWWADPLAAIVVGVVAAREALELSELR